MGLWVKRILDRHLITSFTWICGLNCRENVLEYDESLSRCFTYVLIELDSVFLSQKIQLAFLVTKES